MFYVLCEVDERGYHIVGYFSKEKCSEEGYNLACILTLPAYQRKGYGKMLISFSYELSKKEGQGGNARETALRPRAGELPRVLDRERLSAILKDPSRQVMSIKDLSELTMIKTEDIISTLQHLNLLAYQKGAYVICAAPELIEKHLDIRRAAHGGGEVPHKREANLADPVQRRKGVRQLQGMMRKARADATRNEFESRTIFRAHTRSLRLRPVGFMIQKSRY